MKKILLGVIALTSAASFGAKYEHLHGYLDLEGNTSIEKPVTYNEQNGEVKDLGSQADVTYKLGAKADLGVFMHENKEVFAFIGTNLSGEKERNAALALNNTPYYFGLRWDSEIIDTFNIQLTAAHRRGGERIAWEAKKKLGVDYATPVAENENKPPKKETVIKNNGIDSAIKKHLKAKGKKDDLGTDQGYKLREKDTFLLSAVLNGKIYNNFDLTVAGLYNSEDFKNGSHELETYVKTNGMLKENVKIANAEIKHILNSGNFKRAGKLSGDIKIETKASDVVSLSNEAKFELDSILKENERETKVELLNNGKYTGIKNVELRGDVNYKLTIEEAAAETTLTHKPEAKLGATFKPVKGLEISSDNSNKVTYKHVKATKKDFNNEFITDNKVKYNVTEGIDVHTLAKYTLKTGFDKDGNAVNDPKHTHSLLTGAGLSVNREVADVKVTSTLEGRYSFEGKSKDPRQEFRHQGFIWTENKVSYDFNENNKLEGNVNLYNYMNIKTHTYDNKHKLNGNPDDIFLANVVAKYTNVTGKFTNVVEANAKYGLETTLVVNADVKQGLGLDFNGSTTFKANDNVDVTFGVENNYKLNDFNSEIYGVYVDYIKDAANGKESVVEYAQDKYDVSKQDGLRKNKEDATKTMKDLSAGRIDLNTVKHELSVNPKLDVKMTYVDGKLTVNPWIGAGFSFSNYVENAKKDFLLRNIEGKAGIKVNYVW